MSGESERVEQEQLQERAPVGGETWGDESDDDESDDNEGKCSHPEAVGTRWGDDISDRRKVELEDLSGKQREWLARPAETRGDSAFTDVELTGADVFWLTLRALAGTNDETALVAQAEALRHQAKQDIDDRKHIDMSVLHLEGARLPEAHLEGANFEGAHLEYAHLDGAYLYGAWLSGIHLEHASLLQAQMRGVHISEAHMMYAMLNGAHLEGSGMGRVHLEHAYMEYVHLESAQLWGAYLQDARISEAYMQDAYLSYAHLENCILFLTRMEGTNFTRAHLERTDLTRAHLERANLEGAHLEGADLHMVHLEGTNLREAVFDKASHLNGVLLTGAFLDQVTYDNVNLTVVDWSRLTLLGDELTARNVNDYKGERKGKALLREQFNAAVRANRVLAVTLRSQGMNEDADRFAYRAQLLQQQVLWHQRKFGGYLFSRMLDGLAGYGYKPVRGLIAYLVVILGFALAYGFATHGILTFGLAPSSLKPLQWYEALVLSISSFHGRGFFQPVQSLGDPVAIIAAAEAIIGLLIEISFIATFTQRFFGR